MKNNRIEEMKNNARIYIGATVEKLRMDGCELWEIDRIVDDILNYITVPQDSIVLTKAEKEKLLHEMYEQGRFDAIADLEKEGKVLLTEEKLREIVKEQYQLALKDKVVLTREEWNKLMGDTYTTKELDEIVAYKERVKAREVARDILTKLADDFRVDGMDVEYPLNRVKIYAKQYNVEIKE